jgi:peptide chain release factor subunit 1
LAEKRNSLLLYRLKRMLTTLSSKEGRHTELISLYIPLDKQISDVMSSLRQEYSTASNIKSKSTRKNVMDAIERVMQRLRLFNRPPPNGLVMFCGAIPQNGEGSEKIEIYVIEPPEPTPIYYYRCNHRFHLEPLMEMLRAKGLYGLLVIDGKRATIATLRGSTLNTEKEVTSGIPGKHRAGGQSARRFERLREVEVKAYYKRVGEHVNGLFLQLPDLKGIIIGGPGPTKYDFAQGDYLQYALKERVLTTVDTSYTGDAGLKEVVEKSIDILREVRYIQERKAVQAFLYGLGHDTGMVTYGEREVRRALLNGIVATLLI